MTQPASTTEYTVEKVSRRRGPEFVLLTAVFLISAFAAFLFVRSELRKAEMNQDPNVVYIEPTPEATRTTT